MSRSDDELTTVDSHIATIRFSTGNNGSESSDEESIPSVEHEEHEETMAISNVGGQDSEHVLDSDHVDKTTVSSDIATEDLVHVGRFNPFDNLDNQEEPIFPQLNSPFIKRELSDSLDHWEPICHHDFQDVNKDGSLSNLEMAEDHFSLPEGLSTASIHELEKAAEKYKKMVMESTEKSERQKALVDKLINLRLKLAEAKDNSNVVEPDIRHVVGHRFLKKDSSSTQQYCEKCNTLIWGVLKLWYKCKACGFSVHEKCLNLITRTCPSLLIAENPQYILTICPEKGLASQNYKCTECQSHISYQAGFGEPRQCDYSGLYYCNLCHWNDQVPVPARILHNWDFEPRKVCRASKQFLKLMSKKPVLRVQDINPMLFSFVEELSQVKQYREKILIMKRYFLSCRDALKSKLLLQLRNRQHFVENSDMYSLLDLLDTANDILLPNLVKVHSSFALHIKTDCKTCQGKGFVCELCDYQEILFPFDDHAIVCAKCSTVLHRHCFTRKNRMCPKCERMTRRNTEEEIT